MERNENPAADHGLRRRVDIHLPVMAVALAVVALDWRGWVYEPALMLIVTIVSTITAFLLLEHRRFQPRSLDVVATVMFWCVFASFMIYG